MQLRFVVPFALAFASLVAFGPIARANPEIPAAYDARAVGMAGTGTAFLDSPAAVLQNPANLTLSPDRTQIEFASTMMFVNLQASFSGPGREQDQLVAAPLLFAGSNFRIRERYALGISMYMAMGFGGVFSDVKRYGTGTPCLASIGDAIDFGNIFTGGSIIDETARNADYCPTVPRDEKVTLLILEAAIPFSMRVLDNLDVGVALRVPYGILRQQTSQDIFGALSPDNPQGNFGLGYAQAISSMHGIGTPGVIVGLNYRPIRNLALAFSYRSKTRVDLRGTTTLDLASNELIGGLLDSAGGLPIGWVGQTGLLNIDGLDIQPDDTVQTLVDRITRDIPSRTAWYMPHAFEVGVAGYLLDRRLLLSADFRVQLHREANKGLTIVLDDPLIESMGLGRMTQPFAWKNVYGGQLGAEFRIGDRWAVRGGVSGGNSATPRWTTTQFGVPPGMQISGSLGFGYRHRRVQLDGAASLGGGLPFHIDQRYDANGDLIYEDTCRPGQVIKTGCPGAYGVTSFFLGMNVIYRPDAEDEPAEPARRSGRR